MEGKVLRSILFLIFAVLAHTDVTQAGSSPHDICEIYVDSFSIIYNETVGTLTQAFQDANSSLYLVNIYIPRDDYLDQINMIVLPWFDDNFPTFQAAVDAVAALTGSTSDYISSLIDGTAVNPSSPVSCLYDMIIELDTIINSYYNSLTAIGQLLSDSQLVVGDARPLSA